MTEQNPTHPFVDPVCLMEVTKNSKVSPYTFHFKTYYFCAETCREAFISNPNKYLTAKTPKRKGIWRRYLDRLNKATGGKPPSCCH